MTGAPLLEGFPAWLEARVVDVIQRGDHALFVAEVVGVGATVDAAPFTPGWHYGG